MIGFLPTGDVVDCGPKCFGIPSISMKFVLKIDVFKLSIKATINRFTMCECLRIVFLFFCFLFLTSLSSFIRWRKTRMAVTHHTLKNMVYNTHLTPAAMVQNIDGLEECHFDITES